MYLHTEKCERLNKKTKTMLTSARQPHTLAPKWTTLSWHDHPTKEQIAHTLYWPLRKETPSSSPLFIYSRSSPTDIPPALLRRPRNKHTGQDRVEGLWGEARSWKQAQLSQKHQKWCPWNCNRRVFLCLSLLLLKWSAHTAKVAHFWRARKMLSMYGMVKMA